MSRYRGPRLKKLRRFNAALPGLMNIDPDFRRPYPPGQHGPTKRGKLSDFALRLREKQKLCYHYGVNEKQLKKYMYKSFRGKGNPGLKLLILLELRLDNVVFRSGFLPTIRASRQIINHRHVLVNGKRVDISSYILKPNETISFVKGTEINNIINTTKNNIKSLSVPSYLEIHKDKLSSNIVSVPVRDDIPVIINERLIVEYYSAK